MSIRCPRRIQPRDFDVLDTYAADNPALADMAEDLAWMGDRFSWGTFFTALREFRHRYPGGFQ